MIKKKKDKDIEKINENKTDKTSKKDFVNIGEVSKISGDFVILSDNSGKIKNIGNKFRIFFNIIIFSVLIIIIYLCMTFKIVPSNVEGSYLDFESFSVVPKYYKANPDELKVGDVVICEDEKYDFLPFTINFDLYKYKSRNGTIIYVQDVEGKDTKIFSTDIDYIVRD